MPDPAAAVDPEDLLALRDRFLHALLVPAKPGRTPPALLEMRRPEVAIVRATAAGTPVLLLTWHPAFGSDTELVERLSRATGLLARGMLHVVAVGAGPELVRAIELAFPKVQILRRFAFHRLGADGEFSTIRGAGLPLLVHAAEAARAGADDAQVARNLADLDKNAAEELALEREFAQRLGRGAPAVTLAIAAVCLVLFALQSLWGRGAEGPALFRMGAGSGELVRQGEVWRLVSAAFLHVGLMHLAVNMMSLASLGPMLERMFGARRFLLLYGLSALGGASASALLNPAIPSAGASGALWGLMGAAAGLTLRRGALPPRTRQRMRGPLLATLVMNVFISFQPGIDKWAHFGGGFVGFLLVFAGALSIDGARAAPSGFAPAETPPAPRRAGLAEVLGVLLGVVMIAGVGSALARGKPWELAGTPSAARVVLGDSGLSLEIPASLREHPASNDGSVTVFGWGSLMRDPIAVQVVVGDMGADVDEDLDRLLLQAAVSLAANPPDDSKPAGPPREETLGGRRAMVAEDELANGIRVRRSALFEGRWQVLVTSFAPDTTRGPWAQFGSRIPATLRAEAEAP